MAEGNIQGDVLGEAKTGTENHLGIKEDY